MKENSRNLRKSVLSVMVAMLMLLGDVTVALAADPPEPLTPRYASLTYVQNAGLTMDTINATSCASLN